MKRMIINPAQLKAINEIAMNGGQYNDVSDIKTKLPGIQTNGNTPITFNNSNTAATGGSVTMSKDDLTGNTASASDDLAINNAATFTVTNESRFTKRQVELGRMLEMRRTGKVFSKKQLNEMFMETQENAYIFDEFFNGPDKKPIRKILDGVKECFPEGFDDFLEAVKNGADIPTYIKENFFTSVNSDAEEKFLKKIGAIE